MDLIALWCVESSRRRDEPVSPVLAGGLLTSGPPRKSFCSFLNQVACFLIVQLWEFIIHSGYESCVGYVIYKYFLPVCSLCVCSVAQPCPTVCCTFLYMCLMRERNEIDIYWVPTGLLWRLSGKVSACNAGDPQVGKIPWWRKWQPTSVLLPGKFHGWRSLVGYSPWDSKEMHMTEQLHFSWVPTMR